MNEDSEMLGAEHAAGLLDGEAAARAEARLSSDPAFAAEVEDWRDRLAALPTLVAGATPPAGLMDRIDETIDRLEAAPEKTWTLRRGEGEWTEMAEGVECKLLWRHEKEARQTVLIRMAPGARYDGHHHDAIEECYVVSGELRFGVHELRGGDFHVGLPGSDHPQSFSQEGCMLLITTAA